MSSLTLQRRPQTAPHTTAASAPHTTAASAPHTTAATQPHPTAARRVPEGSEVRGFALYVGVDDVSLAIDGVDLETVVRELKQRLSELAPSAESYASVALAPTGVGGRSVDVARYALGEPAARAQAQAAQANHPTHPTQAGQSPAGAAAADPHPKLRTGVTVDLSRKQLWLDGEIAPLTFREFELLQFFVLREGHTVSRDDILATLWAGDDEEVPHARTIDVMIRRLRVKLGSYSDIIRTVRGRGYRFDRHPDVRVEAAQLRSPDRV